MPNYMSLAIAVPEIHAIKVLRCLSEKLMVIKKGLFVLKEDYADTEIFGPYDQKSK